MNRSFAIKICGLTRPEDVELAVAAGATHLGFIFTSSPRAVAAGFAAASAERVPPEIKRLGVFTTPDAAEVAAVVKAERLTGVQSHADPERLPELRRLLPGLFLLQALDDTATVALMQKSLTTADAVLIDSPRVPGQPRAALRLDVVEHLLAGFAEPERVWLAGGLLPDSVGGVVRRLRPGGVDVASGVESQPGVKDSTRLREFIRAATEAAKGASHVGG